MSAEGPTGEQSFAEALGSMAGVVYVVQPGLALLDTAVAAARRVGDAPTVRVIASGGTLRSFRSRFRAAARAAELVDRGGLSFRAYDEWTATPALVGAETAYAPVIVGTARGVFPGADDSFAAAAYDQCDRHWDDASAFHLHTPPLSVVRETMAAEFGDSARDAFETALDTIDRGSESAFDEVYAVLVIAGHEELLHYDVSKWGEDIGLASKATFSRKKNQLEEWGIIETEKVSVDVGRPRQRLLLTDEYRERVETEGLAGLLSSVVY
ncbi:MAG: DUF5821 family protein [Halobaculum sp.]